MSFSIFLCVLDNLCSEFGVLESAYLIAYDHQIGDSQGIAGCDQYDQSIDWRVIITEDMSYAIMVHGCVGINGVLVHGWFS